MKTREELYHENQKLKSYIWIFASVTSAHPEDEDYSEINQRYLDLISSNDYIDLLDKITERSRRR